MVKLKFWSPVLCKKCEAKVIFSRNNSKTKSIVFWTKWRWCIKFYDTVAFCVLCVQCTSMKNKILLRNFRSNEMSKLFFTIQIVAYFYFNHMTESKWKWENIYQFSQILHTNIYCMIYTTDSYTSHVLLKCPRFH